MRVFKNLFGDGSKIKSTEIAVRKNITVADILTSRKEMLLPASGQPFKPYGLNEPFIELVNGIVFIRGAFANTRLLTSAETGNNPIKIADIPMWAAPSNRPDNISSSVRKISQGSATAIFLLSIDYVGGKWGLYLARYRNGGSANFQEIPNDSFIIVDISYPSS